MLGLCDGAVFMAKKIWMRPGGFSRKAGQVVWGRQWLTLCSICFFCRTRMLLRIVTEEKVENYRNLIMKGEAMCVGFGSY